MNLDPTDEARRKLAYIDSQLAQSDRDPADKISLKKSRDDIVRRNPQVVPPKKVNPFIARAAKKNPLIAKLLSQGKIG